MTYEINETHDPNLKSWVESANDPETDFPIQNLPFCAYSRHTWSEGEKRLGVAIGDFIVDLEDAFHIGDFPLINWNLFEDHRGSLNHYALLGAEVISEIRMELVRLLSEGVENEKRGKIEKFLIPRSDVRFQKHSKIRDYTDFYCSIYHATNVGSMFRPDNPLLPNYKYVPIGYHGRASSIVVSGTEIKRPKGQNRSDAEKPPVFIACKNLDYEMEVGFFVGQGNELGKSIPLAEAEEHIFGVCLVNDWSAPAVVPPALMARAR